MVRLSLFNFNAGELIPVIIGFLNVFINSENLLPEEFYTHLYRAIKSTIDSQILKIRYSNALLSLKQMKLIKIMFT